ncbi:MAG: hypothetical protein ACKO81_18245 [Planctomycetota bacterium]
MPYLIGIDEAGYAPNLGPLVIGGTLWHVPEADCDLYHLLRGAVSRSGSARKVAIADSKELHTPDSIQNLETNLWAVCPQFQAVEKRALTNLLREHSPDLPLEQLADRVAQSSFLWGESDAIPTLHAQFESDPSTTACPLELPHEPLAENHATVAQRFAGCCEEQSVRLLRVVSAPLYPAAFNDLSERLGNKSNLLTALSLQLAGELLGSIPNDPEPVTIFCDKHGGRNRYAAAVERHLSPLPPAHECETAEVSRYRFHSGQRDVRIQFAAGGESQMPVALASMYLAYIRELCMAAFNRYWQREVPGLEPTKGYPADAKRFREAIEPLVAARGWEEHSWWRQR